MQNSVGQELGLGSVGYFCSMWHRVGNRLGPETPGAGTHKPGPTWGAEAWELAGPLSPRGSLSGAQGCWGRRGAQLFCSPMGLGSHPPPALLWSEPVHGQRRCKGMDLVTLQRGTGDADTVRPSLEPPLTPGPTWTSHGGPGTGGLDDSCC